MRKMKLILTLIVVICCCSADTAFENIADSTSDEYLKITRNLSCLEFEIMKKFILDKGDRQTYRNFDNDNPHYSFEGFECYLNSEIGQLNINNDPLLSDFNQITIQDMNADMKYYYIQIVREGDSDDSDIAVLEGMEEGEVYLLNNFNGDIDLANKYLLEYLDKIWSEINLINFIWQFI